MKTKTDFAESVAACLMLVIGLAWAAPADAYTFGGRAFSAQLNTPLVGLAPVYISDTGELSPGGGWEGAALLSTEVPNVLAADVMVAATSGATYTAGPEGDSITSLGDVVVFPGGAAQVTASFVQAQVQATATGLQGSSQINDLTFGGVPVTVTGQPNQTVTIPGVATLTINEQVMTANASSQTVTVNAMHITLATGDEVILSSARSSINW